MLTVPDQNPAREAHAQPDRTAPAGSGREVRMTTAGTGEASVAKPAGSADRMPLFADVILPLALPKRTYTYAVPEGLHDVVQPGVRVEVPFGQSKLYSGLVERVHSQAPGYRLKPIAAVLDEVQVVTPHQFQLWDWMAEYYCCTLGEVMHAALPGHLKLTSETKLVVATAFTGADDMADDLDADEYLLAEALQLQQELTIDDARKILNKKTVFPVVQRLLAKGVLVLREDLQEKYKPRKVTAVRLAEPYRSEPARLKEAFELVGKNDRQLETLMALITLGKTRPFVRKQEVLDKAQASDSTLRTLIKKGVLETYDREISRVAGYEDELAEAGELSAQQARAYSELVQQFEEKQTVLLHGVTGSGKTRLYIELIRDVMRQGGQVLYLLPEIALTTQLVGRLQRVFGNDVAVYHSKVNYQERVELWRGTATGKPVIMAARSGLFLPFQNLRLIIVDEEHDPSFKQYDPAPRYSARDTAIYLAHLHGAKVLLGTATPALESYHNALTGKYGYVELNERFSGLQLPEMETVNLREQAHQKKMHGIFAAPLLEALQKAIDAGEQVILFQNRRGYSPILECNLCGWTAQCRHCDVSLTYHKHLNALRCHYCGYRQDPVPVCPACGSGKMSLLGYGTEKIEDDLKIHLPTVRIGRLDLDTAGSKANLATILNDFEERRLDILVGTQMVTKGLDFDNVGLVGVIGADQLIKFPDFRSSERAFHLLTQVAGRAGRKNKRGRVLIQAYDPSHPVLVEVQRGDFRAFARRELAERQEFRYPPYYRMIHLVLRHKNDKVVFSAADFMARGLRQRLGERVLGPVVPHYGRLRGLYGQEILLKLEKSATVINGAKTLIRELMEELGTKAGWGQVQVAVDVDPV
jgi:primosomal protein N' (replication factor Y)